MQVEAVTDEELKSAVDWDWDEELRQIVPLLRKKLVFLWKSNCIDERTFRRLLHSQGMLPSINAYLITKLKIHYISDLNIIVMFDTTCARLVTDMFVGYF